MDIINKYYEKFNYPSQDKLFKIMKSNGENITRKDIQTFLNKQYEYEMLKVNQKKKNKQGHITAFTFKQNAQLDIYDLSKYSTRNKNYKYILALIDVFSRKVYVRALKNKDTETIVDNLREIFKLDDYIPKLITSDTDSAFMSFEFQKLLKEYDIIHDDIIAGDDHNILGIIDRFALTIKTIFSKLFLKNRNVEWKSYLNYVVDSYNDTIHSSLNGLTPNEATLEQYHYDIAAINIAKAENTILESSFSVNDNVRLRLKSSFKKGSEPRYSDKIYKVTQVNGKRVTLDNDKSYVESDLVKTYNNNTEVNIVNKINKENSAKRRFNKEGLDAANILTTTRRN